MSLFEGIFFFFKSLYGVVTPVLKIVSLSSFLLGACLVILSKLEEGLWVVTGSLSKLNPYNSRLSFFFFSFVLEEKGGGGGGIWF